MGSIIGAGNHGSARVAQYTCACNKPFMLARYKDASFI